MVPKGIFGVCNLMLTSQLVHASWTPVATATKIWAFEHKIGYNSAYIGDMSQIPVPNWGFSRSAIFVVSFKLAPDRTPVAMITKS